MESTGNCFENSFTFTQQYPRNARQNPAKKNPLRTKSEDTEINGQVGHAKLTLEQNNCIQIANYISNRNLGCPLITE